MAQTGDVKFGNSSAESFDLRRAGMGGSDLPDLKQASLIIFLMIEALYQWQDCKIPSVQTAQFFICFEPVIF